MIAIAGNVDIAKPLATPSYFSRSGTDDLALLKTDGDTLAVPAYVGPGTGTIGSERANLTDDDIEKCIRYFCWNMNWTGTNEATAPAPGASETRAAEFFAWRTGGVGPSGNNYAGNEALNGGKGPTISCGRLHAIYCGLLAAYGIAARSVYGGNTGGGVDTVAEYWSPDAGKWVMVLAHTNEHFTLPDGSSASYFDFLAIERNNGGRAGIMVPAYLGGSTGESAGSGVSANDWVGYYAAPLWRRGSKIHTAPAPSTQTDAWTDGGNLFPVLPGGVVTADAVTLRHINDVVFAPNGLHAIVDVVMGLARVQLEARMLDFSKFQVLPDGGAWTDMDVSGVYSFYPVSGTTWSFRALGALGNTTNTVTVTVS